LLTTASKGDTLSVSLLGTADTDNAVAGKELEGRRVNSLLVDNNKVLISSIAEFTFELNDLHNLIVSELSLTGNELFALISVGPEESGVNFGLLVLERDVEAHDVAVLKEAGHVRVSATVVENQTLDEPALS